MEFEKKCFGLKTPNISSNATCQTDGNRLQACLNKNVKQKTHFGFDSHFSERSWHKSSVCIKIASCYTLQKEKKHPSSSYKTWGILKTGLQSHPTPHHTCYSDFTETFTTCLTQSKAKNSSFPMYFLKINHTHYEFKLMLHYLLNHISLLAQYTLQKSVG